MLKKLAGLGIGKVAKITAHSGFDRSWVGPFRQHNGVVVELQNHRIATGKSGHDVWRNTAQISQHTEFAPTTLQTELNWLAGIVWHRFGRDMKISHIETISGPDHDCTLKSLQPAIAGGSRRQKNRQRVRFGQRHHASTMIAVFVSDENCVDILCGEPAMIESLLDVFSR